MPARGTGDFALHCRIEAVSGDRVEVDAGVGERVTVDDPDRLVSHDLVGESRTLPVRCVDWRALDPDPGSDPGLRRGRDGVDVVGTYEGTQSVPETDRLLVSYGGRFRTARVPPRGDADRFDGLPVEPDDRLAVRDAALSIRDCHHEPLYDPFCRPIPGDVTVTVGDRATVAVEPDPSADAGTATRRPADLDTANRSLRVVAASGDRLRALDGALCDLFADDRASVRLGPSLAVDLAAVREDVRYLSRDALEATFRPAGGDAWTARVRFLTAARAVAPARLRSNGSAPTDGVTMALFRRGLAHRRDDRLCAPRDPIENYEGLVQGYALAHGVDEDAVRDVDADALCEWAAFDRVFDGEDEMRSYHEMAVG